MRCIILIFDAISLCSLCFAREYTGISPEPKYEAPLCVILFSSGNARVESGKSSIKCKAGSIALCSQGAFIVPQSECHYIAVGIIGSACTEIIDAVGEVLLTDFAACPMVAEIMRALCDTDIKDNSCRLCYELLCELAHADEGQSSLPILVTNAIQAIRQNYAGLYGVEELSAQLGVSKSHLVRVFSHEMGIPPGQYLTQVRIASAKKLLRSRNYPLEVIATLCGFSGANYLCKVFKRETGHSPAEYRTLLNKQDAPAHEYSQLENELFSF